MPAAGSGSRWRRWRPPGWRAYAGGRAYNADFGLGLLVLFVFMDMLHRVTPGAEWISLLSPIYYFSLSKPLVPSYGTNWGAVLLLLGLTVVFTGAAVWLFARRDVGGVVPLPR